MANLEQVTTNVPGFVRQVRNKIKGGNYLFPMYEALVNSIQAVSKVNGNIHLTIIRSEIQNTLDGSKPKDPNIIGFEIVDNGVGFDEDNYKSFKSSYSDFKADLGCKGVGRFVGLAVFKKIEVNSTYKSKSDGLMYQRSFVFTEAGIDPQNPLKVEETETKTTIKYSGIHEKFLKNPSHSEVADFLLKHILAYYVSGEPPKITVSDTISTNLIDLKELFGKTISVEDDIVPMDISGHKFELYFLKTFFKNFHAHQIHYCANNREVKDVTIATLIPRFINERIKDDNYDKTYFISIYVTGEYLNDGVEEFRNSFTFPTKKSQSQLSNLISLDEINEGVKKIIEERYKEFIDTQTEKIIQETSTYIYTEAQEYKHLLNHPDLLKDINPGLSREQLEATLHMANHEFNRLQRAKVNHFLSTKAEQITNTKEYKEELQSIMDNQNEIGKSNLVKYMHHRKAVLKLFEKFLDIQKNGKHKLEADIHDILFERNKTSNQINFDEHNLWILDERMAYSEYIASNIAPGEKLKPDIFIYDKKFIYGDVNEKIVLFELKRPSRTDYTDEEKDFGKQIFNQVVDIIKSGGGKNDKNRNLNIKANLPKFGFVIADMDNDQIKHHELCGYKPTPKGSLFKYEEGVNLFIEIMTYDQLKEDANLRHRAFFKHLGIDTI